MQKCRASIKKLMTVFFFLNIEYYPTRNCTINLVEKEYRVIAHREVTEGNCRGNVRMEWVVTFT